MLKTRPREIKAVLTMACAAFFLIFGYEIVRSTSYAIFKDYYGKENLPFILACLPIFLIPTLICYEKLLKSYGPRKTLCSISVFSGIVIFISAYFLNHGSKIACIVIFLFREVYSVVILEQYWSFINSVLVAKQAKSYNGIVLCISSFGAICGGLLLSGFCKEFGAYTLLYVTAFSCVIAALISDFAYKQVPDIKPKNKKEKGQAKDLFALSLFKEHRILKIILFMIVASQVYCTVINLNFQGYLQDEYPNIDEQAAISGLCFAILNVASVFFQLVISPILLKRVPLSYIHIGIPFVHLVMISLCVFYQQFWSAALCFMTFKTLDYSLFRAAKEILYIPLPFDARFRAKEFIDVFGFRFTKSGSSFAISIATKLGIVFSGLVFAYVGIFAAASWFYMIYIFSKSYVKALKPSLAVKVKA